MRPLIFFIFLITALLISFLFLGYSMGENKALIYYKTNYYLIKKEKIK